MGISQIFGGNGTGIGKHWYRKSLGTVFGKNWYWKKIPVWEIFGTGKKVSASFKILGTVTLWLSGRSSDTNYLKYFLSPTFLRDLKGNTILSQNEEIMWSKYRANMFEDEYVGVNLWKAIPGGFLILLRAQFKANGPVRGPTARLFGTHWCAF